MVSAWTGVVCGVQGAYPDGYVPIGGAAFIWADQAWAIIGMFAFTQIFEDVDKPLSKTYKTAQIGKILPDLSDQKQVWKVIVKSSLIGSLIGSIPGIGGETGCFVCLGEAKRSSKYPERFGTGILEGVAAPEAGNNGTTGGAMIPMLSLGIPGDAVTAVMLGGLMLHGLTPGPLLFKNHLDVIYPIFAAFIIANIFMGIIGLTMARFYARVINIKKTYLIPTILVLSIIGSYAIQFSFWESSGENRQIHSVLEERGSRSPPGWVLVRRLVSAGVFFRLPLVEGQRPYRPGDARTGAVARRLRNAASRG